MRTSHVSPVVLLCIAATIALTSCTSERIVQGDCQQLYEGEVCTYGTMFGEDVVEFGATITMAAIESAPLEGEMIFPPPFVGRPEMPAEIRHSAGYDHVGINWEHMGHPPGTFLTPHFDFHFYRITTAEVDVIDCSDSNKPDVVPASYVLPDFELPDGGMLVGMCIPTMGMHAGHEQQLGATEIFEATMIVGYYSRNIIFVEPMIAQAKLLKRESFSLDMPMVDADGQDLHWPSSFTAHYVEDSDSYRFAFTM